MDKGTSIPFDQYQRYGVAVRAIEALRKNGEPLNILEVGANTHKLLGRLLPNDRIVYLDREIPLEMQGQDDIIVGDATELSLPDASFDVVVALDVFEHIPKDRREAFLLHTCRIARLLTVIGAPFDSPFVVKAEREASEYWGSLFNHPYRWLAEHAENGLPNYESTIQALTSLGYNPQTLRHGDIKLWTAFIKGHFAEVCVGSLQPVLNILYEYYQDHLFENDFSPSESYRQFIFCSRDATITQKIKDSLDKQPSTVGNGADTEFQIQLLNLLPSIAIEKAGLAHAVDERDRQIANLNQAEHDKEVHIGNLGRILRERDRQIANLNQAEHDKEVHIGNLGRILREREEQVINLIRAETEIRGSTSWRLTSPVRFVGRQLLRIGIVFKALPYALSMCGGYQGLVKHMWRTYEEEGIDGIKRRVLFSASPGSTAAVIDYSQPSLNDYSEWIRRYDTLTDLNRKQIKTRISQLHNPPLISIVMPVYNPPLKMLEDAIRSVQGQLYQNWELCIADDASTGAGVHKLLHRYADNDSRIKVVFREKNGHISAASNSALELVNGEYVALLDNDDLLSEHALFWVAVAIVDNPEAGLIYSDEDKIDTSGSRYHPYFKPDWNPDLFLSHNIVCHLGVYRTDLVRKLGGFRQGYEGAQDYDLALRCSEQLVPRQIVHIPRVLYHWRSHPGSTAQAGSEKNYALVAGERALNDHFARSQVSAKAELLDFGMYRVRYAIPAHAPLISLIIPTRNGLSLIRQCIESILAKTTYKNYEILIVDNNSDDPEALAYFARLAENKRIRILRDERSFNYSALNNAAALQARGEYLCLINNDIEVISPEWLSEMMGLAIQPGVGAVGARLWYPNDTLQHGGVITGLGGVAGHSHKHLSKGSPGFCYRAQLIQAMSVVTAACLIIKKSIYHEVGGLDETNLKVAFNDVDFCLRVREAGYRNVWTPYAELYHHESATRGYEDTPEKQLRFREEVLYMQKRWRYLLMNDPAYSPNLTLEREDFSYAWPPRVSSILMVHFMSDTIFNEDEYLAANPDVALAVKAGQFRSGREHYEKYGKGEGRMLGRLRRLIGESTREKKVFHLLDENGLGLEMGPSHNPIAPKNMGFNVHILDHASAHDLREKYQGHGINLDNIEEVDFIWHGETFQDLIGKTGCYDWIIASHVIEHVPDFVSYLQQCEALLKQDGILSLVIPDKRYCFDYFSSSSSTGNVLDAFSEKRVRPSHRQVFDHVANASKRNGNIAWEKDALGGANDLVHTFADAQAHWEKSVTTKEYIDVHCWRFTPASFRLLVSDLQGLGLIGFEIKAEFDTAGCEFYVSLGKKVDLPVKVDRLKILQTRKLENV